MDALQEPVSTHFEPVYIERAERVSIFSQTVTLEYGGETREASGIDLSASGIAVWAPGASEGDEVRVTLSFEDWLVVRLDGRVVRQFGDDGGSLWGIEFVPSEARMLLEVLFASRSALARAA